MIYRFERRGRQVSTLLVVAAVWIAIAGLYLALDVAIWLAILLAAFTLPALWDAIRDTRAWIEVWPQRLVWQAAFSNGDAADIQSIRLNRRFDGSMKVTLVHLGGATTRLPPDIAPPTEAFEAALKEAGIPSERHPFLPF